MKLFLSETLTCTQTMWTKSGNGSTKSLKSKNLPPTLNLQSYLQIKSSKFEKSWFRKSRTLIWRWIDKGKWTCKEAETIKGDFTDQANHHTTLTIVDGIMKQITSSQDQREIDPIQPTPIHLGPSSEKISSETHILLSWFQFFIFPLLFFLWITIYFLWLCFSKKVFINPVNFDFIWSQKNPFLSEVAYSEYHCSKGHDSLTQTKRWLFFRRIQSFWHPNKLHYDIFTWVVDWGISNELNRLWGSLSFDDNWFFGLPGLIYFVFCPFSFLLCNLLAFNGLQIIFAEGQFSDCDIVDDDIKVCRSFRKKVSNSVWDLISLSEKLSGRELCNDGSEDFIADGRHNFLLIICAQFGVNGV